MKNTNFRFLGAFVLTAALLPALAFAGGPTFKVIPPPPYMARTTQVKVTAITPTLLTSLNTNYQSAFNSWNGSLAAADQWTLNFGGQFSNTAAITVSTYTATAQGDGGGVDIVVDYTPGTDPKNPAQGTAKWAQSVQDNFKPKDADLPNPLSPGNPWLDGPFNFTVPGQTDPLPLYPFNNAQSSFSDSPFQSLGPGGQARTILFDAYLSTVDGKKLTVYNGIEYGFTIVPVPELGTQVSFGVLILLSGVLFLRRAKKPQQA